MFIHFQLLFEFIQIFLLGLLLFPLFGVLSPWSDSIAVAVSPWVLLKENWGEKMSKTFFYLSLFTVICIFFNQCWKNSYFCSSKQASISCVFSPSHLASTVLVPYFIGHSLQGTPLFPNYPSNDANLELYHCINAI